MFGGLKAPNIEGLKSEDSRVCETGVDGEAIEAGDPRLLRLLNPAGEVKLCSDVDPKLLESGEWSSMSSMSSISSSSPSECLAWPLNMSWDPGCLPLLLPMG